MKDFELNFDEKGKFKGTVCLVGAGHAAHVMMAFLPFRKIRTVVYAGYGDEADRLNAKLSRPDAVITADFAPHLTPSGLVKGRPAKISKNPADVIPEADVILLPLPSFAYEGVLKSILPHLRPGQFIGATPGQGGFDYIARRALGPVAKDVVLFAQQCMPFNCRIQEFGVSVQVQQLEGWFNVFSEPESANEMVCKLTRAMYISKGMGEITARGNFWGASLAPLNANIHPQRLYTLWKDYKPGVVYDRNPLFYEEMTETGGGLMHKTSEEIAEIGKGLSKVLGSPVYTEHIFNAEFRSFPDPHYHRVDELFAHSAAYKGFRAPMIPVEGGFIPNFRNRYFTEDVPYGLCVWRGIAELIGVTTPTIDLLIRWCQHNMGKEYLTADGRMAGKDIKETSAPQAYGIASARALVGLTAAKL